MGMTKEEYANTQQQILLVCSLLREMPLEDFIEWIEKAEAVGPIVNPTLYRESRGNIELVKKLAEKLLAVKISIPKERISAS